MKYFSIDIETTGLDPEKHQILEFAAIYDNLIDPVEQLPRFIRKIKWVDYVISDYCLKLHQENGLLDEIRGGNKSGGTIERVVVPIENLNGLVIHICQLASQFRNWLTNLDLPNRNYNVAGKNFAGFDAQFLKRIPNFPPWDYRVIDIGSMYLEKEMSGVPGLGDIIGSASTHRALDDAERVVELVRKKLLSEQCRAEVVENSSFCSKHNSAESSADEYPMNTSWQNH